MNANVKKEMRSLAPMIGLTMAATVALSLILTGSDASGMIVFVFAGCCALMSATSFGNEFSTKTMPLLLAQPVSRRRLWSEKITVLGIALALSYGLLVFCLRFMAHGEARPENYMDVYGGAFLLVLVAFCSGPGLTLIGRNTLIGLATMVSTPLSCFGLVALLMWLGGKIMGNPGLLFTVTVDRHPYFYISAAAVLYSSLTYWFGCKIFSQLQPIDTIATEIRLPNALQIKLAPVLKRFLPGYSGPLASLVRKELLLHRGSFLVAGALCLMVAAGGFLCMIHPGELSLVLVYCGLAILGLLMPVLTGALAIAEERTWGTLGWQLTLPPSPATQWRVKLYIALATSVLLGVLLPMMLMGVGALLGHEPFRDFFFTEKWGGMIEWTFGGVVLFAVMFLGSSLSANSLRAVICGFGLMIAGGLMIALVNYIAIKTLTRPLLSPSELSWVQNNFPKSTQQFYWWYGVMYGGLVLLAAIFFGTIRFLAFSNFRSGDISVRRYWRSVIIFLAVFIVIYVSAALLIMFAFSFGFL